MSSLMVETDRPIAAAGDGDIASVTATPEVSPLHDKAVEDRLKRWEACFDVKNEIVRFQLRQFATESIRLERAYDEEDARRARIMARAELCWEPDRMSATLEIAAKLHRNPQRWREQLLGTAQGCRWMISEWRQLRTALNRPGGWNDRQKSRALDLLGISPLYREGSTPVDVPPDADPEHLDRLIATEIEELTELLESSLKPADEFERDQAIHGVTMSFDRESQALRRYISSCVQRHSQLWRTLSPYYHAKSPRPNTRARTTPNESQPRPTFEGPGLLIKTIRDITEHRSKAMPTPQPVAARNPDVPQARPAPPTKRGNRRERRRVAAMAKRNAN